MYRHHCISDGCYGFFKKKKYVRSLLFELMMQVNSQLMAATFNTMFNIPIQWNSKEPILG